MAVDGTWNCVLQSPMGAQDMTITLMSKGSELAGTMTGRDKVLPINAGKVDGDNVRWKTNITAPMSMTLEFTATVEGDEITGNVKLGFFGSAPLKGTRA